MKILMVLVGVGIVVLGMLACGTITVPHCYSQGGAPQLEYSNGRGYEIHPECHNDGVVWPETKWDLGPEELVKQETIALHNQNHWHCAEPARRGRYEIAQGFKFDTQCDIPVMPMPVQVK